MEDTTTDEEEDTVTDELAVEPEEDSPSAEYMLTDRDPTNRQIEMDRNAGWLPDGCVRQMYMQLLLCTSMMILCCMCACRSVFVA